MFSKPPQLLPLHKPSPARRRLQSAGLLLLLRMHCNFDSSGGGTTHTVRHTSWNSVQGLSDRKLRTLTSFGVYLPDLRGREHSTLRQPRPVKLHFKQQVDPARADKLFCSLSVPADMVTPPPSLFDLGSKFPQLREGRKKETRLQPRRRQVLF